MICPEAWNVLTPLQLTGNPFWGTKLLGFSIGRGQGALNGVQQILHNMSFSAGTGSTADDLFMRYTLYEVEVLHLFFFLEAPTHLRDSPPRKKKWVEKLQVQPVNKSETHMA